MKVLLTIHHPLDPDLGAPGVTLALGAALQAAGCDVEFYGYDQAFPGQPGGGGVGQALRFPWRLASFLARRAADFDVIDASTGDAWAWARRGRPGARRRHVLATRSHGLEHIIDRDLRAAARSGGERPSWKYPFYHGGFRLWEVTQSLRRADHCFLLNAPDRDFVRDTLDVPPDRLTVLPNGINGLFHDPASDPVASGGTLRLAFVGTWIARKGNDVIVKAMQSLTEAGLPVHLSLLGTGQSAAEVLADFPAPLREHIEVRPRFKNTELPALLRAEEVLLFPSRSEGFGLALVEAMACGLVPIATPVGIAPGVIAPGENGLLVPISDPAALADAVRALSADRDALLRMRRQARTSVDDFRWDRIAAETIRVYEDVLARRGVTAP